MAEPYDIERVKARILSAAKPLARAGGWISLDSARLAADAGVEMAELRLIFPRLGVDLAALYLQTGDRELVARHEAAEPLPKSMREKIAALIWLRLSIEGEDKALARKTAALFALPPYMVEGLGHIAQSADQIWRIAGDHSADFSYYTKRLSLAAIYAQALLFYLSPAGDSDGAVKAFIAKEIDLLLNAAKLFNFSKAAEAG